MTRPAAGDTGPYRLTCYATLSAGQTIRRRIIIEGAEASGAGLDCNGATIRVPGPPATTSEPVVAIWSRKDAAAWSVPHGIRIRGCVVHGNIRIWGLGRGDIEALRASSRTANHTAAAQAAAPSDISLDDVTLIGTGSIPLYVGPGVTRVSVSGGTFQGRSVSTAVYLDAESADNAIRDVTFDIDTGREIVAVDGSARNRIESNRFRLNGRGGVFLYRNCGEDGVIRHQTPADNRIVGNLFEGASWLRQSAIVVGAREGRRRYCADDAGWPYGSSADDGDRVSGTVVRGNTVRRGLRPF